MGKDIDKGHVLRAALTEGGQAGLNAATLLQRIRTSGAEKRPEGAARAHYIICFAAAVSSAQHTSQLWGLLVGTFT